MGKPRLVGSGRWRVGGEFRPEDETVESLQVKARGVSSMNVMIVLGRCGGRGVLWMRRILLGYQLWTLICRERGPNWRGASAVDIVGDK